MVTMVNDRQMGFSLGAADYLTKPIDFERLYQVIERHRRPAGPKTVLVVEDDPGARELLRCALEKEGWQVVEAANGQAGLDRLAGIRPSLILLDLMMPVMDGFEFLQELSKRPLLHVAPVVVITARELTEEDRRRLAGNVARVLQKSSTRVEDLLAEVLAATRSNQGEGI
jgi:CheY-like chemotaxis protein